MMKFKKLAPMAIAVLMATSVMAPSAVSVFAEGEATAPAPVSAEVDKSAKHEMMSALVEGIDNYRFNHGVIDDNLKRFGITTGEQVQKALDLVDSAVGSDPMADYSSEAYDAVMPYINSLQGNKPADVEPEGPQPVEQPAEQPQANKPKDNGAKPVAPKQDSTSDKPNTVDPKAENPSDVAPNKQTEPQDKAIQDKKSQDKEVKTEPKKAQAITTVQKTNENIQRKATIPRTSSFSNFQKNQYGIVIGALVMALAAVGGIVYTIKRPSK